MSDINIAQWTHRIEFLRPVDTPDGGGGNTRTYQSFTPPRPAWARRDEKRKSDEADAGRMIYGDHITFTTWRRTVSTDWKVRYQGRDYCVASFRIPDENGRLMVLNLEI